MVGRISIRWTSLPFFLRTGFPGNGDNRCFLSPSTLPVMFATCTRSALLRYCLVIVFISMASIIGLFLLAGVHRGRSKSRRFILTDLNEHGPNSQYFYGVVVDCGSSGSRVFIYYWPPHNGNPDELLQIKQMKDSRGSPVRMKIKPGIASYVDGPSEVSTYLEPLLDFATFHVPQHKHKETPLYILATAGMRMLSKASQDAILDDLKVDIPLKYNFQFTASHVEVITGKQEGVYSWIGVNYELGRFDHSPVVSDSMNASVSEVPHKKTVGSLDMGGGSAQIAFEVGKSVWLPSDLSASVNLGCDSHHTTHSYHLYVATFLGFGGNAARERYTEFVLSHNGTLNFDSITGALLDHCLPAECTEKSSYKGKEFSFLGTGEYLKCQELVTPLLNLSQPCPRQPCSLNGVHQPIIDFENSEFYGFSEYWYSMNDVLRIGGEYNASLMKQAVEEFCGTRWSVLVKRHAKGLYPFADDHRLKFQCFKAAWMTSVLHRGFHFPLNYGGLHTAFLIGDKEVQWTLGAILYRTRFLPLREMQLHSQYNSSYHVLWSYVSDLQFRVIFMVCSVTVVSAILLYCRRLRRMSNSRLWKYNSRVLFDSSDVFLQGKEKMPV